MTAKNAGGSNRGCRTTMASPGIWSISRRFPTEVTPRRSLDCETVTSLLPTAGDTLRTESAPGFLRTTDSHGAMNGVSAATRQAGILATREQFSGQMENVSPSIITTTTILRNATSPAPSGRPKRNDKTEGTVPVWKRPVWIWTEKFRGLPFSAEWLSAAFDVNVAPFYQSFIEVRVNVSQGLVPVIPHGVHATAAGPNPTATPLASCQRWNGLRTNRKPSPAAAPPASRRGNQGLVTTRATACRSNATRLATISCFTTDDRESTDDSGIFWLCFHLCTSVICGS